MLNRRTDIDGLRCVAVLPIVLFHAGLSGLPGGYMGVDVFFVISGFLITSIIERELVDGNFSLLGFYQRRIARIFPALLVMLALVLVAGCVLMLPFELEQLGWAAIAAATFVANIRYRQTTDYFGGAAETDPLLHTWSLGVEEQFYILFPFILLLAWRDAHAWRRWIVLGLVALALAASFTIAGRDQASAFYMLQSRAWQLGLGAVLAMWPVVRPATGAGRLAGSVLATTGLGLITLGYVVEPPSGLQSLPWGIPAAVGSALVIAFAPGTWVHGALSLAPLRWIGAISFSLYLYHWPIMAFYRIRNGIELAWTESLALVALSIVTGAVSYYLIEQPCLRRFRDGRPRAVVGWGLAAIVPLAVSAFLIAANPAGFRPLAPAIARLSAVASYPTTAAFRNQFRPGTCFHTSGSAPYDYDNCPRIDPSRRNIALIGDSHAAQFWQTLQQRLAGANVIQLTASGCAILVDGKGTDRCETLSRFAFGPFLERGGFDAAILSARWQDSELPQLDATIRLLVRHQVAVTVIGPNEEFEGSFPLLLARTTEMGHPEHIEHMRLQSKVALDTRVRRVAEAAGARYVSLHDAECGGGTCVYFAASGVPLHFDYGHYTRDGADYVLREFPEI